MPASYLIPATTSGAHQDQERDYPVGEEKAEEDYSGENIETTMNMLLEDKPFDVIQADLSLDDSYGNVGTGSGNDKGNGGGGGGGGGVRSSRSKNVEGEDDPLFRHSTTEDRYGRSSRKTRTKTPTNEVGDLPALTTPAKSSKATTTKAVSATKTTTPASEEESEPINLNDTTLLTRNVTGGRGESRTRPLSPPSRAGLDDPEVYQRRSYDKNRRSSSKDYDDSDDDDVYVENDQGTGVGAAASAASTGDTSGLTSRGLTSRGPSYRNEMPMDERNEYESDMKALGLCDYTTAYNYDPSQGLPDFCETTLNTLNDMCYGGDSQHYSTQQQKRVVDTTTTTTSSDEKDIQGKIPLKLGDKHLVKNAAGTEEQTSIEVEYVEPMYRGRDNDDGNDDNNYTSPKRKNALLKAMTRRAKDDFNKLGNKKGSKNNNKNSKGLDTTADESLEEDETKTETTPTPTPTPNQQPDNVYATFTSYEKSKFLQLINTGISPFDATGQVLKERDTNNGGGSNPDGSIADSSSNSEYNPGGVDGSVIEDDDDDDGKEEGEGGGDNNANAAALASSPTTSTSKGSGNKQRRTKSKLAFWKRGTIKKNSDTTPPKPKPIYSPDVTINENDQDQDDDSVETYDYENDRPSLMKDDDDEEAEEVIIAVHNSNDEVDEVDEDVDNNNDDGDDEGVEVQEEDEGDEEEGEADNDSLQFAKSGISYYDAVRKNDRSEDDDDDRDNYDESGKSKGSRRRKLMIPLKGLSKALSKRNNNNSRGRATPVLDEDEQIVQEGEEEGERIAAIRSATSSPTRSASKQTTTTTTTPTMRIIGGVNDDSNEDYNDYNDDEADDEVEDGPTGNKSSPTQISPSSVVDEPMHQLQQTLSKESLLDDTVTSNNNDTAAKLLGLPALTKSTSNDDDDNDDDDGENDDKNDDDEASDQQQQPIVDLNMDAYFNSTETILSPRSNAGGVGNSNTNTSFDVGSVMSGKSYRTSQTNMSTRSTRSRRPGQAKVRLQAHAQSQSQSTEGGGSDNINNISISSNGTSATGRTTKSITGWKESIEAVAAATGKEWDPDHGWKDYIDPTSRNECSTEDFYGSMPMPVPVPVDAERYVDNNTNINSPNEQQQQQQQKDIPIQMVDDDGESLNAFMDENETATTDNVVVSRTTGGAVIEERSVITSSGARSVATTGNISTNSSPSRRRRAAAASSRMNAAKKPSQLQDDDKPRGWAETMKAATAKLNMDGDKRWDPIHGWIGMTEKEKFDLMLQSEEEEQQKKREQQQLSLGGYGDEYTRDNAAIIAITADSDMQDFGIIVRSKSDVEQLEEIANNLDQSNIQFLSGEEDESPNDDEMTKKYNEMEESQEEQVASTEDDDTAAASKSMGRYIQIADSGSVQSHYRVPKDKMPKSLLSSPLEDDEEIPGSIVSTATTTLSPGSSETLRKIKEAHRREQEELSRRNKSPGRMVDVQKHTLDQDDADFFPREESTNADRRRRSNGPVDLDEIFEQEEYTSSFRPVLNDSVVSGKNANEVYQKIYEQQSDGSFDAGTDFSWDADEAVIDSGISGNDNSNRKPVPRLKINIRDSSSASLPPRSTKSTGTGRIGGGGAAKAQSEVSFDSTSTSSKSIPKLAGPKRDTSPIRGTRTTTRTVISESKETIHAANTDTDFGRDPMNDSKQDQVQDDEPVSHPVQPGQEDEPVLQHGQDAVDASRSFQQRFHTAARSSIQNDVEDNRAVAAAHCVDNITKASTNPSASIPPNVSQLHNFWEKRTTSWDGDDDIAGPPSITRSPPPPQTTSPSQVNNSHQSSEWKSFLVKKVQAENKAAAASYQQDEERDTIFDFPGGSDGNTKKLLARAPAQRRNSKSGEPQDVTAFDDISELSPIRHDDTDSEYSKSVVSEASTAFVQGTTFLQRLQACAAPIVYKSSNNCNSEGPISAHLAFLRSNPNVTGSSPEAAKPSNDSTSTSRRILEASSGLCGRPDVIVEDDDENSEGETTQSTMNNRQDKKKKSTTNSSRSDPRSRQNDDLSSVISDGFGAKSAYLEALAMKAAVSGGSSKKKKRRSTGSDTSVATNSSKHSEKFKQFLDRRSPPNKDSDNNNNRQSPPKEQEQPLPSKKPPIPTGGRSELLSNRAEKYASEKVNEMMDVMAGRSSNKDSNNTNKGRSKEEYEETGAFPTLSRSSAPPPPMGSRTPTPTHNDAARIAAEELAAARVEIMMQRLSCAQNLEDDEAEI